MFNISQRRPSCLHPSGKEQARWVCPEDLPLAKTKGTAHKQGLPPRGRLQSLLHTPSSAPPFNPAPLGTLQPNSSKCDWPERETEAEMDREREPKTGRQRDRERRRGRGEGGHRSAAWSLGGPQGITRGDPAGGQEGDRGGGGRGERSGWDNLPQGRGTGGKSSPTLHPLKSQPAALRRCRRVTGVLGCELSRLLECKP